MIDSSRIVMGLDVVFDSRIVKPDVPAIKGFNGKLFFFLEIQIYHGLRRLQ